MIDFPFLRFNRWDDNINAKTEIEEGDDDLRPFDAYNPFGALNVYNGRRQGIQYDFSFYVVICRQLYRYITCTGRHVLYEMVPNGTYDDSIFEKYSHLVLHSGRCEGAYRDSDYRAVVISNGTAFEMKQVNEYIRNQGLYNLAVEFFEELSPGDVYQCLGKSFGSRAIFESWIDTIDRDALKKLIIIGMANREKDFIFPNHSFDDEEEDENSGKSRGVDENEPESEFDVDDQGKRHFFKESERNEIERIRQRFLAERQR